MKILSPNKIPDIQTTEQDLQASDRLQSNLNIQTRTNAVTNSSEICQKQAEKDDSDSQSNEGCGQEFSGSMKVKVMGRGPTIQDIF